MPRTKIELVGVLRFSSEGLLFSLPVGQTRKSLWLETLPNWDNWPGLVKPTELPERPKMKFGTRREDDFERSARQAANKAAEDTWKAAEEEYNRAYAAYMEALHSDLTYRQAAVNFVKLQRREPQALEAWRNVWDNLYAYRDKVLRLHSDEPETLRDKASDVMLIKHFVLRKERGYEKVRREVEALENMERLEGVSREPIPESVRLFVWQRDQGQCVKCGSRERLEFDHIIPIASGGGNTERNVQLLCERCNRSKGATI
ncbi:MAG TPA: HNH endonuclease signature motif containing protein [Candidatus Binataceae bacterium]|nr:HNH endonuclease signature motif containing protein [Candidatus Binataceae bacterium]